MFNVGDPVATRRRPDVPLVVVDASVSRDSFFYTLDMVVCRSADASDKKRYAFLPEELHLREK